MTIPVVLKAGDRQSGRVDLSWEGEAELQLSVGPVLRGRFLNMDIGTLNGIAYRSDVSLQIDGLPYELRSVDRTGEFEAAAISLSGSSM